MTKNDQDKEKCKQADVLAWRKVNNMLPTVATILLGMHEIDGEERERYLTPVNSSLEQAKQTLDGLTYLEQENAPALRRTQADVYRYFAEVCECRQDNDGYQKNRQLEYKTLLKIPQVLRTKEDCNRMNSYINQLPVLETPGCFSIFKNLLKRSQARSTPGSSASRPLL